MVCTRLRAKFRHRTTRHFGGDRGPRQNKEFLKYLVWQIFSVEIYERTHGETEEVQHLMRTPRRAV